MNRPSDIKTVEVRAAVCVLESSLALAADWPQLLSEYLVPLLSRLTEGSSPVCSFNPVVLKTD